MSSFSLAQIVWSMPESSSSDKSQGADGSETVLEFEFTGVAGEFWDCIHYKLKQLKYCWIWIKSCNNHKMQTFCSSSGVQNDQALIQFCDSLAGNLSTT